MSESTDESSLDDINIRHFKLSSGDEVIGMVIDPREVDDEEGSISEDGLIVLNRPMRIDIIEKDDRTVFLFHKWQPVSKYSYCLLNPAHVVSHTECDESTKHQYIGICTAINDVDNESQVMHTALDQEFYEKIRLLDDTDINNNNDDNTSDSKDCAVSNGNPSGRFH